MDSRYTGCSVCEASEESGGSCGERWAYKLGGLCSRNSISAAVMINNFEPSNLLGIDYAFKIASAIRHIENNICAF